MFWVIIFLPKSRRSLATTGKALLCASNEGQPALHPERLALICVMQYVANLSDRGATEAVAARIDWKYALGMELSDSSFDTSVLNLFRSRLLVGIEPRWM